jgi:hypothetical protein
MDKEICYYPDCIHYPKVWGGPLWIKREFNRHAHLPNACFQCVHRAHHDNYVSKEEADANKAVEAAD